MKKLLSVFLILALLLSGCSVEVVLAPEETLPPPTTVTAQDSDDLLTVHFLDVGQADCILIECAEEFLLIDGGNREDGQKVVSYLQSCGVEELEAVICTHAHEGHVGGLPAVLAVYPTAAVYAPTKTYSSNVFDDFLYYTDQQRLEVTIPAPGDSFYLGSAEILILGPVQSYAETNDTSIVVKLTHGESTFLFTGDMEVAAENDMLDYWEDRVDWNVDVLKSGHHGSSTSSGYRFIYETDPEYIVIPVGKDNTYGHPHEEIIDRYKDAGIPMFRTDELGTILAVSDGTEITITWEKQNAAPEDIAPAEGEGTVFIGNKNSKTLHGPDCNSLPKEENRIYFDSYQEAIDAGYKPCGSCLG
jgi:competence protein ComEC